MKEEKKIDFIKHIKHKQLDISLICKNVAHTIMDNKCEDPNKIEWSLDALIPHLSNKEVRQLYIDLLEYYKNIDSEGAAYYWEIFDNDYRIHPNSISLNSFNEDFFYD